MSRFVRASKVRHVYCDLAKPDFQYHDLRLSSATGDHNYIKANTEFFAYPVETGGGALTVVPLSNYGKLNPVLPVFDGHHGPVLDFEFSPFHTNIIATGGDDCTVKVWSIPEGGLTENIMDPLVNLAEHQKKVVVLRFHPTADGVLASGGADQGVKVWDVRHGMSRVTCNDNTQLIQDVVWNYNGTLLASSCKDKVMRVIDPRTGETVQSTIAHDGTKTSKLTFLGPSGKLCSVGFTRSSKRQFKIWDPRNLDSALSVCDIDQGSGSIMPFFDEDTGLLFLAGKGDGNIRYFEITDQTPYQFHVGEYRASTPAKGVAMLPKRACDVSKCEVTRLLKLTKNSVEPLSVIVPRKSDMFQSDLYPDCYAGRATLTADEFFDGKIASPALASMDPSQKGDKEEESKTLEIPPIKTAWDLEKELEATRDYVKQLQERLRENNIEFPSTPKSVTSA